MYYYHVDVFCTKAYAGNGLTVVLHEHELATSYMQSIATELKQFETIFLRRIHSTCYRARIFTVEEELDFAGHPILGGVAVLHSVTSPSIATADFTLQLNQKEVQIHSKQQDSVFTESMNQGPAHLLKTLTPKEALPFLQAVNLTPSQLHKEYPLEVISTGLPYLLYPILSGIEDVNIVVSDLSDRLRSIGAKFIYVFDLTTLEGRTWDNKGLVEDVATGSAAGPVASYLYRHGIISCSKEICLSQGRFLHRPSKIYISQTNNEELLVRGNVKLVLKGSFL